MSGTTTKAAYRTWAEIDLGALRRNAAVIRRRLNPATQILAVVKADAFGHGAVAVARALQAPIGSEGKPAVEWFGVGDVAEALELRAAGIFLPILILGAPIAAEIAPAIAADVSLAVSTWPMALAIEAEAARQERRAGVHLAVDTGMHRLGVPDTEALELATAIVAQCPHLDLDGIFSHFSSADESDRGFSHRQLQKFFDVLAVLRAHQIEPPLIHAANSAALANYEAAQFTMVRPGLALYGLDPGFRADDALALTPVLALKSQVVDVRVVAEGQPVSYTRLHYAPTPSVVATLPLGYADGYRRALSRPGGPASAVLIRGRRYRIIGRITMDYTMLDLGPTTATTSADRADDFPVVPGDVATLIGRDGDAEISATTVAEWADTISYEITCALGRRVTRLYRHTDSPTDPFRPFDPTAFPA